MKKIKLIDRNGRIRHGKKVAIKTTFDCEVDDIWQKVQNISTLIRICKPMARFTARNGETIPQKWEIGKKYQFNLFMHNIFPVGRHTIMLEFIDRSNGEIQSREYNAFVPVWNHLIRIEKGESGKVVYTDEIEIYAGILTNFVAWWSVKFYQHRQRNWRDILNE